MALHFILDGYNIIQQVPAWVDGSLAQGRERLVQFIENEAPHGSSQNWVTVVFDGQADVVGPPMATKVKVIFTTEESADEMIKAMVDESLNAKAITVVTDDREIQYFVRALGARVMKVRDFLKKAAPQAAPPRKKKEISKKAEHNINTEFEKIWLKKRKDTPS